LEEQQTQPSQLTPLELVLPLVVPLSVVLELQPHTRTDSTRPKVTANARRRALGCAVARPNVVFIFAFPVAFATWVSPLEGDVDAL
jgi:hypothetical protein